MTVSRAASDGTWCSRVRHRAEPRRAAGARSRCRQRPRRSGTSGRSARRRPSRHADQGRHDRSRDAGAMARVRRVRGARPDAAARVMACSPASGTTSARSSGRPRTSSPSWCPRRARRASSRYVLRSRDLIRLKGSLLRIPNVVVTDVPVVMDEGAGARCGRPSADPPADGDVWCSSASVNDVTIRAVNYARSLEATETRAIYFDLDPEEAHRLESRLVRCGTRDAAGHRRGAVPRPDDPDARGGPAVHVTARHRRQRDRPRVHRVEVVAAARCTTRTRCSSSGCSCSRSGPC